MNKKQKVLTVVMLPIWVVAGLFFFGPPSDSFAAAFTAWFVVAVIYAGLFFVLK